MTGSADEPPVQALVEHIPGAVYRRAAARPWSFAYVSATIESLTGHRAQDLVAPGAPIGALQPVPEDLARVAATITGSVSTGRPYTLEYRIRHADGTTLWVEDRGRPGGDAAGAMTWIDGVIFDVTERKSAELALVEQRARLIALMEAIPDHIYFKDADSRFTMISRALARSFGLHDPDEAVGTPG